ncbi:cytochrome b5 [Eremomyces bilateralis CBS 781.70]|uniref:Cytochrome b5 n=1 Tax=Eremomyces bilateralis CBS 781.70 TaxID=1392243 RepID=A0A6G1GHJ5_9PEZI|nr:cytochrome b5 [Eremomyces bilateralis CBS 781.70]KAF1817340.1 cytochrome b5 [Eremomyces bilateralis CBS 781.70]
MATATQTIDSRADLVAEVPKTMEAVHVEDVSVAEIADKLEKTDIEEDKPLKTYTEADVAVHNKPDDFWLIVRGEVFDMTKFQNDHPGGFKILNGVRGKDATKKYMKYHRLGILAQYRHLVVGKVVAGGEKPKEPKKLFGFIKRN